jgi:hypothetical protein
MHAHRVLPGFPADVIEDYIKPLVDAGLVRAGEKDDYSELEAEIIRTYARMIRVEGHPDAQALGLTIERFRSAVGARQEAEPVFPFPAGIPVLSAVVAPTGIAFAEILNAPPATREASPASSVAVTSGAAILETAAAAKLASLNAEKEAAERREHLIMTEMAQVRARFERFREETALLRKEMDDQRAEMAAEQRSALERIRDLDEERNKSRFRIARIENAFRAPVRRAGFWDRLKAAFGVILGNATIVPLLPESVDRPETAEQEPLEKAA